MKIGYVGPASTGGALARRLQSNPLNVFDRDRVAVQRMKDLGARPCASLAEVVPAGPARNFFLENHIRNHILSGKLASGFTVGLLHKDGKRHRGLPVHQVPVSRRNAMRNLMKRALLVAALASVLPWGAAHAQQFPSKPVKMILPTGPGSSTDIVARSLADELRTELGQPFVVENKAGANGFIAAEAAARSAPDGYTLFVTSTTTQSNNQFLFKKLPYDPVKDFAPVAGINETYYVLTVPSSLPVNTVAELVAWLKANPTKASYGWGGAVSQIAGAAFLKEVNATATGVPYKSNPQAATDLMGGQLTFMVQGITAGLGFVKNGKVKALMVSAPARVPQLPGVPTGVESGVPGFDATSWVGIFVPAGTPEPIVARLNAALQKVLRKPGMVERMDSCCAARLMHTTPAEFNEFLRKDRARWAAQINAAGIQPE